MAGMFFMYVLGTIFMICTGFAMYGEGLGMQSWAFTAFSSWVLPLLGYSQNVHTLHHLGMWYLLVFTIVHLYMVVREDICSERDRHQHDGQRLAGGEEVSSRPAPEEPVVPAPPAGVLVLGIGNVLWADEGFGVRAVEALHQRYSMPANVSLVDGGTQGMYLLDYVCSADRVLVLDAIDYKLAPGTLRVFRDDEVPVWSDTMMSLHQATFQELLSLARLRGRFPSRITLIGVQPDVLDDLGGSLSPLVRARLDEAVGLAVAELSAWGIEVDAARRAARGAAEPRRAGDRTPTKRGRPSEAEACRIGDARFLNRSHGTDGA